MHLKPLNHKQSECKETLQLKICTQFYPPDYAATGQLIEELAIHLECMGILVQVFTGQPGYAFQKESAPLRERSGNLLIQRSRSSRICDRAFVEKG